MLTTEQKLSKVELRFLEEMKKTGWPIHLRWFLIFLFTLLIGFVPSEFLPGRFSGVLEGGETFFSKNGLLYLSVAVILGLFFQYIVSRFSTRLIGLIVDGVRQIKVRGVGKLLEIKRDDDFHYLILQSQQLNKLRVSKFDSRSYQVGDNLEFEYLKYSRIPLRIKVLSDGQNYSDLYKKLIK